MSDSQNHGFSEPGQRAQAMSEPRPEPRLRPQWEQFQGAPLPVGPLPAGMPPAAPIPTGSLPTGPLSTGYPANGRLIPPYEAFEDLRVAPQSAASQSSAAAANFSAANVPPPSVGPLGAGPYSVPPTAPLPPSATPLPPAPSHAPFAGPAPAYTPVSEQPAMPAPPPAAAAAAAATTTSTAPLANTAPDDPNAPKSGLQKAIHSMRTALPFVQKLLPLLDGNFATVVGALMAPHTGHPPAPPQVRVDLEPIERGLTEVKTGQRELKLQVAEQGTSLKRVEDQLERVREATDRNTLEQQELVEDLRSVGNRVSTFAVIGLILLGVSLLVNVYFLVQLQHILR